ncbi:glycosyltransferase, partial [Shewanella sp. T24-MNA-CIBAN-0130]
MRENVWIIIVNYKSYKDTASYVTKLLDQEGVNLSIVIVDNDSGNNSFEILTELFCSVPNVDVHQSGENLGYARGNNLGVILSDIKNDDLVVISNNDLVVTEIDFFYR